MPDEPRELSELTVEIAATLFAGTVLQLATTDGGLRSRLLDAYGGVTMEVVRFADELPPAIGTRVVDLHDHLTGGAGGLDDDGRGSLRLALDAMSGDELTEAARTICFLADDLNFEVMRGTRGPSSTEWPTGMPPD